MHGKRQSLLCCVLAEAGCHALRNILCFHTSAFCFSSACKRCVLGHCRNPANRLCVFHQCSCPASRGQLPDRTDTRCLPHLVSIPIQHLPVPVPQQSYWAPAGRHAQPLRALQPSCDNARVAPSRPWRFFRTRSRAHARWIWCAAVRQCFACNCVYQSLARGGVGPCPHT